MGKAEDRALEKYPLMSDDDKEGLDALKYIGMECECVSVFNEVQESKQAYFIEGYHQAEKDLKLTWKDIKLIMDIVDSENLKPCLFDEIDYQEVLNRFNEQKEDGKV